MAQAMMRGVADGGHREGYTIENYYAQGPGHRSRIPVRYGYANTNSSNSNSAEVNSTSEVDLSRVQRCECCPYGYHIDLDFLNFCDDISSGANLKKIKKTKRSRSHNKVKSIRPPPPLIPPRSSSLPPKRNKKSKDKLEPDKILEKENAAFWKIYQQFAKLLRKESNLEDLNVPAVEASFLDTQSLPPDSYDHNLSDLETDSVVSLPQGYPPEMERRSSLPSYQVLQYALNNKMDIYNSNINGPLSISNLVSMSHQSDSTSSLSSMGSSSAFSPIPNGGSYTDIDYMKRPLSSASSIGELSTASGRSTPSSVSTNALSAVRQQMATALLRLKQLEEQVKAIPVLQVKISVLKEEKRLLVLQLKSKSKDRHLRHVGVCDGIVEVDGVITVNGDVSTPYYELPNTDMVHTSVRSPKPTRPFSPGSPGRAPSPRFGFHSGRPSSPGPASPGVMRRTSSPGPTSPTPSSPQYRPMSPLKSPQHRTQGPPTSPKPSIPKGKPHLPPVPPKKAYVTPVPRPKAETRSVGVDANMISTALKSPETKSIGINVDLISEAEKPNTAKVIERKSKMQPVKLSSVHLRTVRSMASWDNKRSVDSSGGGGSCSSADMVAEGKEVIREGPITAIRANNVSYSPSSHPDSPSEHPTTNSFTNSSPQSPTRANALQQDCNERLISPTTLNIQTYAAAPLQQQTIKNVCERGTITDNIQTRIMGTNTKPPVSPKRTDASIGTDLHGSATSMRDASVTARIQPSNMQSTETEVIEMVEFGAGTSVKCEESGVNTVSVLTVERGTCPGLSFDNVRYFKSVVGVDSGTSTAEEGVEALPETSSCQDSSTSTEMIEAEEKDTNTENAKLVTSSCNTDKQAEYVDICVGDDIDLNDIICCRKADTHTIGTNTSQMLESRSRTIGIGLCSVADSYCIKCDNIQTRTIGIGGGRTSDCLMRTRTIGTNHNVLSRTIGVGSDMVCDPKSLLGSVTTAVGDRDVNDAMCNVCDKKQQRTIGMGIRIPTRDAAIGDGPVAEQLNIGVGLCTIMDRICDKCDNLNTVSVGIGSSDVNRYTHSRSIQVGEVSSDSAIVAPLCSSPTKFGLTTFASLYSDENDSVFLTESSSETTAELLGDIDDVPAGESSVEDVDSAPPTTTLAEMMGEEIRPDHFQQLHEAFTPMFSKLTSMQESEHLTRNMAPQRENGSSQPPEGTISTGSLNYEIHVPMDEQAMLGNGFSNPHAMLADESPGAHAPKTTLAATIMKRGSQDSGTEGHLSETEVPELKVASSSAMSSSSSGSDSSETESDSSNSTSSTSTSSEDLGSLSGSPPKGSSRSSSRNSGGGKRNGKKETEEGEKDGGVKKNGVENSEMMNVEVGDETRQACITLGKLFVQPGEGNNKDLTTCMATVAKNWFRITSQKSSDPRQVTGFLEVVAKDAGKAVLERIVNIADSNGNTALHYSVSHGNFDIVLLLLDTGVCQTDKPNRAGYTTIMLASLVPIQNKKHSSVVSRLFREGDVNQRASQAGQTALMLAVSKGRLDMVKLLLTAGSDVNTQDEDGSTALMCASEHGHLDIVKVLLSHPQCDPHLEDNDGSTAFSIAMEAGHKDIGVLLYAHMNFGKQSSSSKKKSSGPTSPQRHVSSSAANHPRPHSVSLSQGPTRSTSSSSISSLPAQPTTNHQETFSSISKRGRSMLNLTTTSGSSSSSSGSTNGPSAPTCRSHTTSPTTEDLPPAQLFRSRSLSPSSRTPSFRALQLPKGPNSSHASRIPTPPSVSPKRAAVILAAQRSLSAHSSHRNCGLPANGAESPAAQRRASPTKKVYGAQGKASSTGSSSAKSSPRQTPLQKKGIKPASKYSTV
ncbi:KN motif and ankyrin repeat domain-containing protein 1 [Strongylocentrotus purpuratus]|uniref:Uncharacterized protein n=1 Tax=Strongylocentrotus purpuratus TaxID=7668 RepID=A0A7M7PJC8_STRPU|nr:KN motif and ankyrin repeat domain-containing protein 1 [Strongylocentrotus purpuratus]XP_030852356.1 KN motif and ankyrin repeat domain-containing protein 1 [Strongylocentrotus purpuratus]